MRNPGYMNDEIGPWWYNCDVLFNGVDFGPNLQYSKLTFLPAAMRKNQIKIPGMPGVYDDSTSPAGYPVPDNLQGTLELFVKNPKEWGTPVWDPEALALVSPEARFLSIINSGKVELLFVNSNLFHLNADLQVTKYTRFDLGFFITLKIDAEPYWWENGMQSVEWSFYGPRYNYFSPDAITINPTARATCEYTVAPLDPTVGMFILHAPPGWYANVEIPNLDPTATYSFYCRNIYNKGVYQLFDGNGNQLMNEFTGVSTLTLTLISRSAEELAVGFRDVVLYDITGQGVETGAITTLDAPVRSALYTTNQIVTATIGDQMFTLMPGEDVELFGLNVPPRSSVPVVVTGETGAIGHIMWRRGALSCTL